MREDEDRRRMSGVEKQTRVLVPFSCQTHHFPSSSSSARGLEPEHLQHLLGPIDSQSLAPLNDFRSRRVVRIRFRYCVACSRVLEGIFEMYRAQQCFALAIGRQDSSDREVVAFRRGRWGSFGMSREDLQMVGNRIREDEVASTIIVDEVEYMA